MKLVESIIKETLLNEELYKEYIKLDEGGTEGLSHEIRQAEKNVQYNVLKQLSGNDNTVVIALIDLFGGYFRKIIKEFRKEGKIPNEEELLRYTAKYYGQDPRVVAQGLKNENRG